MAKWSPVLPINAETLRGSHALCIRMESLSRPGQNSHHADRVSFCEGLGGGESMQRAVVIPVSRSGSQTSSRPQAPPLPSIIPAAPCLSSKRKRAFHQLKVAVLHSESISE
jgi:hypothetical protein